MKKHPARLVIPVWGKSYINNLVELTLPALLAPGNLPCLAEHYDCELVIVTEKTAFERIEASHGFQEVQKFAKAWCVAVDDLIVKNWYGVTLTYAHLRGFSDLGEGMRDYYLLFLNADFILADNSYRSLVKHMQNGERQIFAPSYCTILEEIVPFLVSKKKKDTGVLALPAREMATVGLANRHYTIRAKTINQRMFRMHRNDQSYWNIDEHTLLARQMPIALVCMKPERVITELNTFWDFGITSEFCPETTPCVIGDSDDFLMIELRTDSTFEDLFTLGWPTKGEIAADLSTWTTRDQRMMGQYSLVLHDRDLPVNFDEEKSRMDAYMDDIYGMLSPEPKDHVNHQYWAEIIDRFKKIQQENLRENEQKGEPEPEPDSEPLPTIFLAVRRFMRPIFYSTGSMLKWILAPLYSRLFGRAPRVGKLHPYWSDLHYAMRAIDDVLGKPDSNTLIIANENSILAAAVKEASSEYIEVDFSRDPRVSDRLEKENNAAFNLCVCEVGYGELCKFRDTYQSLRSHMKKGGKVVVLHLNNTFREISKSDLTLIKCAFPYTDPARIFFGGSFFSILAIRVFNLASSLEARYPGWGGLPAGFLLAIGGPLAFIGNIVANRRHPHAFPEHCTSITIEIDVV